jgi:hypothetical protein
LPERYKLSVAFLIYAFILPSSWNGRFLISFS